MTIQLSTANFGWLLAPALTSYFRQFGLLVMVLFPASEALAQQNEDSLTYSCSLTLGGRRQSGVFSQTLLNGSLTTRLSRSHWSLDNKTTYTYSVANGFQLSNDWAVVSKLTYSLPKQPKLSPTLLHIYKTNLLYRIQHEQRLLLGLHIRPNKEKESFWFFFGGGYEHTLYNGEVFANSPLVNSTRSFALAIFYLENEHQIIKKVLTLKYGLFYIQSLEELNDITLWVLPSLNLTVNQRLIFSISYDYRFRNVHIVDVPSFNEQLTFNLIVSLGQRD